jgi:hypothetical protein
MGTEWSDHAIMREWIIQSLPRSKDRAPRPTKSELCRWEDDGGLVLPDRRLSDRLDSQEYSQ